MQKPLLAKIALIALVAALLEIPVAMIRGLIAERRQARDGVLAEIARGSGGAQALAGPVLYVPWTRRSLEAGKERLERGQAAFLPDILIVDGHVDVQTKHRSLYEARVFTLQVTLRGTFRLPAGLGVPPGGELDGTSAALAIGVRDVRGLRGPVALDWEGVRLALEPGGIEAAGVPSGVRANLGAFAAKQVGAPASVHEFRVTLTLTGTERLEIAPLGATSDIALASNWPHPSFSGHLLPEAGTTVSGAGFRARWRTSHFATNLAQLHQRCVHSRQCEPFQKHTLSASFLQPVDLYQSAERSVKYGFLFVGLTFAALFVFEALRRLRIHPVQYAFVGVALAIFFLLLLSLAEHLGFALAYATAAASCVTLIGYYVGHVLGSARHGAGFGAALAALYGLLYVLLRAEEHALLAGSLLVFASLAAAMVATRRVDWYALGAEDRA